MCVGDPAYSWTGDVSALTRLSPSLPGQNVGVPIRSGRPVAPEPPRRRGVFIDRSFPHLSTINPVSFICRPETSSGGPLSPSGRSLLFITCFPCLFSDLCTLYKAIWKLNSSAICCPFLCLAYSTIAAFNHV